jgi:hypothetical protein
MATALVASGVGKIFSCCSLLQCTLSDAFCRFLPLTHSNTLHLTSSSPTISTLAPRFLLVEVLLPTSVFDRGLAFTVNRGPISKTSVAMLHVGSAWLSGYSRCELSPWLAQRRLLAS